MARYAPLWQQAGSYAAALDRSLLAALWPSGGCTGGVVTAVAATMNVQAAPGTAAVPLQSGQGVALCLWDANEVVTLPAAPPSGQSRVDLVIAQVRDHALDAGANNDFIVTSVTGVPAASNPGVPALPTNALAIAQVLVPGAVANLNTATVTDVRPGVLTVPPVLGYTEVTADQAALGNLPTNVTGLACAFTLPVARRVSVAAQAVFTHDASNNAATYLRIVDGATPLILRSLFLNANFIGTIACERTVPMAAGAHNIYVQAWTSAGSVNLNASDAGNGPQAAWIRATAAP